MLFTSFIFWIIYPIIFILYWMIPQRILWLRNLFLVSTSFLIYLNWNPFFSLVLLFVCLTTYIGAFIVKRNKRSFTILLIVLTIFPLLFFKYYNFINDTLASVLTFAHVQFNFPGLNWAIPVGISFFTFQALGYLLDVLQNKTELERNFLNYLLFCSFFPQTVSGPISKASELLPQINRQTNFDYQLVRKGFLAVLWGLFLKLVVADRLGVYVTTISANYIYNNGPTCLLASFFYSFQIYADFAGYSFLAIGLGKTLGFNLINNFERPYFAPSVTLFWHRWHISLTRWLTNYVYIPLGGNRCSKIRQYMNIMITFFISGLWHGANWTFLAWGAIHGLLQILEKILGIDPKGKNANNAFLLKIKPLRILFTFTLITFAWIFFLMPSVKDSIGFISKILFDFSGRPFFSTNSEMLISFIGITVLILKEFLEEYFPNFSLFENKYVIVRWTAYFFVITSILLFGILDSSNFIYVSF